jgi:ribonuclease T1
MTRTPSPTPPRGGRASWLTLLVTLAVAAVYFLNTGALASLLPGLYPSADDPAAVATATAAAATATADFLEGTPEQLFYPPTRPPATQAALAAGGTAVQSAATPKPASTPRPASTPEPAATQQAAVPDAIDGLPTITLAALPPEALETIDRIDAGGPFPFDQDGTVFQNREGILPDAPRGFYREYTVITPGEDDRGARRIVGADDGTLYYTDDHYESFRVIVR